MPGQVDCNGGPPGSPIAGSIFSCFRRGKCWPFFKFSGRASSPPSERLAGAEARAPLPGGMVGRRSRFLPRSSSSCSSSGCLSYSQRTEIRNTFGSGGAPVSGLFLGPASGNLLMLEARRCPKKPLRSLFWVPSGRATTVGFTCGPLSCPRAVGNAGSIQSSSCQKER